MWPFGPVFESASVVSDSLFVVLLKLQAQAEQYKPLFLLVSTPNNPNAGLVVT